MSYVPLDKVSLRPTTRQPLAKDASYSGRLAEMGADDASALLAELLGYFGFTSSGNMQGPMAGLRGDPLADADVDVLSIMRLGIQYLASLANWSGRRQIECYCATEPHLAALVQRRVELKEAELQAAAMAELRTEERRRQNDRSAGRREYRQAQLVYFIGGETGPVKIGLAKNPARRLQTLQTSHPEKLQILATTAGGAYGERAYHTRFAKHRVAGEWFARHPSIVAEIDRLRREHAQAPHCPGSGSA